MTETTIILKNEQIRQKINRIAHEIYENNFETKKLFVVGISAQGYILAERLCAVLKSICDSEIILVKLTLDKNNPLSKPIELSESVENLSGEAVVLVDDVLNSGKTLIYAASYLLQMPLKKLSTACLVDRRHRRFPIRADFVGLTLSTTLKEHIKVEFKHGEDTVYLV